MRALRLALPAALLLAAACSSDDPVSLALRLSAGRGFRTPDFNEQFITFHHADFGYRVQGNPALRAERSNNLSGSAEWTGARLYVRVDGYENRFRDFIEETILPDTSGVTLYTYQNVGRGVTRGVDVETVLRLGRARLEASAGRLRAFAVAGDGRPGGALLNRPSGTARLAQTLARRGAGELQAQLGVNNLLEARPALWPGFTGRQLYTGLGWTAGRARTGP